MGPKRPSEEEGSGGVCTARRAARPLPGCGLPASTSRVKFKATRTRVHQAQKENTTESILEKVEERKRNFLSDIY